MLWFHSFRSASQPVPCTPQPYRDSCILPHFSLSGSLSEWRHLPSSWSTDVSLVSCIRQGHILSEKSVLLLFLHHSHWPDMLHLPGSLSRIAHQTASFYPWKLSASIPLEGLADHQTAIFHISGHISLAVHTLPDVLNTSWRYRFLPPDNRLLAYKRTDFSHNFVLHLASLRSLKI